MAVLALVGAVMTGCSNDDIVDIDQPGNDNIERLTVVANLDGSTTRALTNEGVKTYAVGDKIAVVYKNTNGNTVKAESDALTDGDITGGGKSAKFTVTLVDADKNQDVTYIYPAAMAKENGSVNYDALDDEQDGTLATLASKFDYCTFTGAWNGDKLPTAELTNKLFVCEFTLKYSGASINDKVTAMTISYNGYRNFYVYRTPSNDPIYVAIIPTANSGNDINYTAIADGKVYTKSVTGKTYAAGAMRPIILNMEQNNDLLPGLFYINGKKAYFAKGNLQATTTDNGTNWTWGFAAHQWDYVGNAEANTAINGDKTVSTNGTVDLFGWSTPATYYGINNSTTYNIYTGSFRDWGNVFGYDSGWSTLSNAEWESLFKYRTNAAAKYGYATVNSVHGIIILPDVFTDPNKNNGSNAFVGSTTIGWDANVYTSENWAFMEAAGAVFLPAAGYRSGSSVSSDGGNGYYWTSKTYDSNSSRAYPLQFDSSNWDTDTSRDRIYGYSVRLARKVE